MTSTLHLHASDEPELVRTPAVTYASIIGAGSPGTDEFYRKKAFIGDIARQLGDGSTPAIEIQYWYPDGSTPVEIADFYSVNAIPSLQYRVIAVVPDDTTNEDLTTARLNAASTSERATDVVEILTIPEHDVVQIMHHGPFSDEFRTLARLGTFADARGLYRTGPHHELHLDGFTRSTSQEKLRTILRDPVAGH